MDIPINDLPVLGPIQKVGHFCLDSTTLVRRSMQHNGWVLFSRHSKFAGILSPRFPINLHRNFFLQRDCCFPALAYQLSITETDFYLSQVEGTTN